MTKKSIKKRGILVKSKSNKNGMKRVNTDGAVSIRYIPRNNEPGIILNGCNSVRKAIAQLENIVMDTKTPPLYVFSTSSDRWQKLLKISSEWTYSTLENPLRPDRHRVLDICDVLEEFTYTDILSMSVYNSED